MNSSYGGGKCPSLTTSLSHRLFTRCPVFIRADIKGFSAGDWLYHSKELIVLLSLCVQSRMQNFTGHLYSKSAKVRVFRARSRRNKFGATLALHKARVNSLAIQDIMK